MCVKADVWVFSTMIILCLGQVSVNMAVCSVSHISNNEHINCLCAWQGTVTVVHVGMPTFAVICTVLCRHNCSEHKKGLCLRLFCAYKQ